MRCQDPAIAATHEGCASIDSRFEVGADADVGSHRWIREVQRRAGRLRPLQAELVWSDRVHRGAKNDPFDGADLEPRRKPVKGDDRQSWGRADDQVPCGGGGAVALGHRARDVVAETRVGGLQAEDLRGGVRGIICQRSDQKCPEK